jgi:NAD(P)-dependent dehydrogenase (short-subunit alcohol dehydrogenase family)
MKKKYNFFFNKKNIVITGGAGHLGSKLAFAFADLGANVFIIDKDLSTKGKIINKFKIKKIKVFDADLSDPKDIKNVYTKIKNKNIKINCLINNAAFVNLKSKKSYFGKLSQQSYEVFNDAIKINLIAPFLMSKYFSNIMPKSFKPSIINVSSIYSSLAPDFNFYKGTKMGNSAAYSSSKSGLNQLTRWLASYLGPKIRVNSISPGGIYRSQNSKFLKKYKSKVLLKRMAKEEDIIGPILFLASEMSNYITGINLVVDGGYSSI